MAGVFHPPIVITNGPTRDAVALKFVESMTIVMDGLDGLDDEQIVVDKLKGDYHLFIRTVSGKEYTISMMVQKESFTKYRMSDDLQDLRQSIFDKWYSSVSKT